MDAQSLSTTDVAADQTPDASREQPPSERRPSRWLALAFVAMLSALVLIGTTGIGAAAVSLISGPVDGCGGP